LDELTNPVLDVWVREQVVSGLQRSTINKHIYLMNRMLNLARHWCLVPAHNPDQQPIKRLIVGDYKQRFLTEAEIEQLLKCCARSSHPYLHHFVQILLLTGARKGEARTARWRDIDLDKRIWTVPRSKNGRSRRIVLNSNAIDSFNSIRRTAERLQQPTLPTSFVFTNPRTGRAYDSFYAAWYVARDQAKLDDVRIHDLRHTFASLLINKGVSLYEVQTLLGHSSVQMTQRYAHLAPDRLHSRAEIVSGIVGKSI
jgi:integrase